MKQILACALMIVLLIVFMNSIMPELVYRGVLRPETARLIVLILGVMVLTGILSMFLDGTIPVMIGLIVLLFALHRYGYVDLWPHKLLPV